jgi:tRNA (mo5U34)-methyltransferase
MITEADRAGTVDALPWPNVRGKRCLDLGSVEGQLARALEQRGATEVVALADGSPLDDRQLDPAKLGRFDIVVGDGVLARCRDPLEALICVRRLTTGMLLSAEPIELWSSVLGRGRPQITLVDGLADGRRRTFNGAGHKQLLDAAGFSVERVSKPYVVPSPVDHPGPRWRGWLDALGQRAITGSSRPGQLHRALLARADER